MKHFILSLVLIIAALYAGSTYYYYSRTQPSRMLQRLFIQLKATPYPAPQHSLRKRRPAY